MKKSIVKAIFILMMTITLTFSVYFPVKAESQSNLTPIMGQTKANKEQMIKYLMSNNTKKDYAYSEYFVQTVINEAAVEGVRADVTFALMMKETNFLKFTGTVTEDQNNFGGLGVTGDKDPITEKPIKGEYFGSIQLGIRAVIQHLKAYASDQPLKQQSVDNRFTYVQRKSAEFVEWLGIKENPLGKGWASDQGYGYDIVNRVNYIYSIVVGKATNAKFTVNSDKFYRGNTYIFTGTGSSTNKLLYQYWIKENGKDSWQILQDWTENNTLSWSPNKQGGFRLELHVKDSLSNREYDDIYIQDINVINPTASNALFNINSNSIYRNNEYVISSQANSINGELYQYWIRDLDKENWTIIKDWSDSKELNWTPKIAGKYRLELHVKDKLSSNNFDANFYQDITVLGAEASNASYTFSSDNYYVNGDYVIKGNGLSENGLLYQYWIRSLQADNSWKILKDWNSNGTVTWTPTQKGQYRIELHIKDKNSKRDFDSNFYKDITVNEYNASNASFVINSNDLYTGNKYSITGNGNSTTKTLYQYWIRDLSKNNWSILNDWSEVASFNWTPTSKGSYRIELHIKDKSSSKDYDSNFFKDIVVKEVVATDAYYNINSDNSTLYTGVSYEFNGTGKSLNNILYQYWIRDLDKGNWSILKDWSNDSVLLWKSDREGSYRIELHIKDSKSSKEFNSAYYKDIKMESPKANSAKIIISSNDYIMNNKYTITAEGKGINKVLYQYWIRDLDKENWMILSDWSSNNSLSWVPKTFGSYRIELHIKDELSKRTFDDGYFIDLRVDDPNAKASNAYFELGEVVRPAKDYTILGQGQSNNKILYQYWIRDINSDSWQLLSDWNESNSYSWNPTKPGKYRLEIHLKDIRSKSDFDSKFYKDITVASYIVMLDPGHGGSDSGAVSGGVNEKDVNLSVALLAKNKLEELGIYVVMSRSTDVYLPLTTISGLANEILPDLSISIHSNSATPDAQGVEVYHSLRDPLKANGQKISNLLASYVSSLTHEKNRGAKTRASGDNPSTDYYHVIRETNCISVILEMGFLTNESDRNKLVNSPEDFAEAIKLAVKDYFVM